RLAVPERTRAERIRGHARWSAVPHQPAAWRQLRLRGPPRRGLACAAAVTHGLRAQGSGIGERGLATTKTEEIRKVDARHGGSRYLDLPGENRYTSKPTC